MTEIGRAVEAVCEGWEGTPYVRGQRMKGVAVDCANFVCAALDELGDYPEAEAPSRPPAPLLGAIASSEWHIAAMMRKYPHDRVDDVEAGDVVFVQTAGAFASHVLLAVSPVGWWHATRDAGVCRSSAGTWGSQVVRVLRPRDKHLWICRQA